MLIASMDSKQVSTKILVEFHHYIESVKIVFDFEIVENTPKLLRSIFNDLNNF